MIDGRLSLSSQLRDRRRLSRQQRIKREHRITRFHLTSVCQRRS